MAAGDGNFALACAREGAERRGHGHLPGRWSSAAGRAPRSEGYDIEWVEADAEDLPFEDARFDCVGLGVRRDDRPAARGRPPRSSSGSCARATRSGMTAWTPDSFSRRAVRGRAGATRPPPDGHARPASSGATRTPSGERFDGLAARWRWSAGRSPGRRRLARGRSWRALERDAPPQVAARRPCRRSSSRRCTPTTWTWSAAGPAATAR